PAYDAPVTAHAKRAALSPLFRRDDPPLVCHLSAAGGVYDHRPALHLGRQRGLRSIPVLLGHRIRGRARAIADRIGSLPGPWLPGPIEWHPGRPDLLEPAARGGGAGPRAASRSDGGGP